MRIPEAAHTIDLNVNQIKVSHAVQIGRKEGGGAAAAVTMPAYVIHILLLFALSRIF